MKSDPHEPAKRDKRFDKNERDEDFFFFLNQVLHQTKLPSDYQGDGGSRIPIVYIVGAPRSGTTLLSQLVSRHLPVGYINNLIARFWLKPSAGIRISQSLLPGLAPKNISLHSVHGTTEGIINPHEFGYFWRYWLKIDHSPTHHLSPEMLSAIDRAGLKSALEDEILSTFGVPVMFKNVICGFHAKFLTRLHPASIFVYISRNPKIVAASILKTRMDRYGSYDTWWSLKPSGYPFGIINDPVAEVVMQVNECRREMELELSDPAVHSIRITYEALCESPKCVLDDISLKLSEMGFSVDPDYSELANLEISPGPEDLPPDIINRLKE
jgi:hypothetical protein